MVLIPWKLFPLAAIFVCQKKFSLWQPILGMLKMYSEKKIKQRYKYKVKKALTNVNTSFKICYLR